MPLGFGTKMFDFDNDGDLDIHVTNGHVIDNVQLYQPHTLRAEGPAVRERAADASATSPPQSGPALQAERVGRGLAVADFDNDGNLDVVISSVGQRAGAAEESRRASEATGSRFGRRARKSNGFGLGATVQVETSEGVQVGEINNVASYLSSNDIRLHFGLGAAKIDPADRDPLAERREADPEGRRRQSDPDRQGTVKRVSTSKTNSQLPRRMP